MANLKFPLLALTAGALCACHPAPPQDADLPTNNAPVIAPSTGDPITAGDTITPTAPTDIDLYNRLTSGGVFVVGTEGTYVPYTYHDPATGELTGYDVEVTRAVAQKLGVTVEFQETQWDGMMAGLDANRFDAIANQMSLTTPERQAKYNKTTPYNWSASVLVTPTGDTTYNQWSDLNGATSAQSISSHYAELAERYGAQVLGVEGLAQALEMVRQGRADVTINDNLAIAAYLKEMPDSGIQIKLNAPADEQPRGAGLALRKDDVASLAKLNEAMDALHADGTLTRLSHQFFGADYSTRESLSAPAPVAP